MFGGPPTDDAGETVVKQIRTGSYSFKVWPKRWRELLLKGEKQEDFLIDVGRVTVSQGAMQTVTVILPPSAGY